MGRPSSTTFVVDRTGPTATITLAPTATNAALIALSGSATDTATGGSTVTAVTYSVDGGTATTIPVTAGTTVALSASITTSALAEGPHSVTVTATDSLGNVGAPSTAAPFVVDRTGPTVSGVTVSPSPNNGTQGTSYDPTVVEVRSSYADPVTAGVASGVVVGEAFLGTTGANGAGFPMWLYPGSAPTALLGHVPGQRATRFPNGPLTVHVHAKDAAGNWGASPPGRCRSPATPTRSSPATSSRRRRSCRRGRPRSTAPAPTAGSPGRTP